MKTITLDYETNTKAVLNFEDTPQVKLFVDKSNFADNELMGSKVVLTGDNFVGSVKGHEVEIHDFRAFERIRDIKENAGIFINIDKIKPAYALTRDSRSGKPVTETEFNKALANIDPMDARVIE